MGIAGICRAELLWFPSKLLAEGGKRRGLLGLPHFRFRFRQRHRRDRERKTTTVAAFGTAKMAAKDIYSSVMRPLCRASRQLRVDPASTTRRQFNSSSSSSSSSSSHPPSNAASDLAELDTGLDSRSPSSPVSKESLARSFDPVARSQARTKQLPPSRCVTKPTKSIHFSVHPNVSSRLSVTNSALPNTIVVLFTLTALLLPAIHHPVFSFPDPSPFPAFNKPMSQQSPRIF